MAVEQVLSSRTPGKTTAARGGRARAPLSSVPSNLLQKDNARTPHRLNTGRNRNIDRGSITSTAKKKQPKPKTRRKNEIGRPWDKSDTTGHAVRQADGGGGTASETASSAQRKRSSDTASEYGRARRLPSVRNYESADRSGTFQAPTRGRGEAATHAADLSHVGEPMPVARLGSDRQPPILNFGYTSNVVGKGRSLPLRIEAPPSPLSDPDAQFPVECKRPIRSRFELILSGGCEAARQECEACDVASVNGDLNVPRVIIHLKQAESKIINVHWTPTEEGEVRGEIHLISPWGRLRICVIGIARCRADCDDPLRSAESIGREKRDLTGFHSRDNITHDAQQWEGIQCAVFTSWMNDLFCSGKKAHQSMKENLSAEWKAARELFDSPKMQAIRCSVEREVREGRLAISPNSNRNPLAATPRSKRSIINEVYVQEQLTHLLLSYTHQWLQLGLGIVIAANDDPMFKTSTQMTKDSLKKIIMQKVLSEPSAVQKYTGGRCRTPSGKFESKMRITVHQHALSQIMILVFFLDMAKCNQVLAEDPCLFERASCVKSTSEVLISLCQDCFSKPASIIKHLDYEGISACHIQNPLDEYDFYVKNLAVHLKDGVCLVRMIDIVTNKNLLSLMRLPADTRQHKIYNVNVALSALRQLKVRNISDITTAHIVSAHQPRILQLLWSTILHFELPEFRQEIVHYGVSRLIQSSARRFLGVRRYRIARLGMVLFQSVYRGFNARTVATSRRNAAIDIQKMWREQGTTRLYRFDLMGIVRATASTEIQRLWRGYNAKTNYGHYHMGVITVQSVLRRFLAQNSADKFSRRMSNASTEIQRMWRGHYAKINYECDLTGIIKAQSLFRRFLACNRVDEMFRITNTASIEIQKMWRGHSAKISYGCNLMDIIIVQSVCRSRIARMYKSMSNASVEIQRVWRGYSAKVFYGSHLMNIIAIQSTARCFVAQKIAARRNASTRKIQCIVRVWTAKRLYRRVLASNHARYLKPYVVCLQKWYRGWLCRVQLSVVSDTLARVRSPRGFCTPLRGSEEASFGTKPTREEKSEIEQDSRVVGAIADNKTPEHHSPPSILRPDFLFSSSCTTSIMLDGKETPYTTMHDAHQGCPAQKFASLADEMADAGVNNTVSNGYKILEVQASPMVLQNTKGTPLTTNNTPRNPFADILEQSDDSDNVSTHSHTSKVSSSSLSFSSSCMSSMLQEDDREKSVCTKHVPRKQLFYPDEFEQPSNVDRDSLCLKDCGINTPEHSSTHEALVLRTHNIAFTWKHEPRKEDVPILAHNTKQLVSRDGDGVYVTNNFSLDNHASDTQSPRHRNSEVTVSGAPFGTTHACKENDARPVDIEFPRHRYPKVIVSGASFGTKQACKEKNTRSVDETEQVSRVVGITSDSNTPGNQSRPKMHSPSVVFTSTCTGSMLLGDKETSYSTKHAPQQVVCPAQTLASLTDKRKQEVRDAGVTNFTNDASSGYKILHVQALSSLSSPRGSVLQSDKRTSSVTTHTPGNPFASILGELDDSDVVGPLVASTCEASMLQDDDGKTSVCTKYVHRKQCLYPDELEQVCQDHDINAPEMQSPINYSSTHEALVLNTNTVFTTTQHEPRKQYLWPVGQASVLVDEKEQLVSGDGDGIYDINNFSFDKNPKRQHSTKTVLPSTRGDDDEIVFTTFDEVDRLTETNSSTHVSSGNASVNSLSTYASESSFVEAETVPLLVHTMSLISRQKSTVMVAETKQLQLVKDAAVTKLSSVYRGHDTRDRCVSVIQRYYRKFRAHNAITKLRRNATIVQAKVRYRACQSQYVTLTTGFILLQAQARGLIARTATRNVRNRRAKAVFDHLLAATMVQCAFRRYLLTKEYRSLQKVTVLPQAFCRGRKARRENATQHGRIQVLQRASLKNTAAVNIQRQWRGYMKNVDFMLLILATIKIQSFARKHMTVTKYRHLLKSVVCAQANFRGRKAREVFLIKQEMQRIAETQIQRTWVNKQLKAMVVSAALIQDVVRGRQASSIEEKVDNFLLTQMRSVPNPSPQASEKHASSFEIQRIWSGHRAKVQFMLEVTSSIKIQAVTRGRQSRNDVALQLKAILILQRAARAMLLYMQNKADSAAIEIQRIWRGYRDNVFFMIAVVSSIRIQASIRGSQTRNGIAAQQKLSDLLHRVSAVTKLQRAARVKLKRVNDEVECFAATEIQRMWRGYTATADFHLVVTSAIKMQTVFRGILARHDVAAKERAIITLQHAARFMLTRIRIQVKSFAATEIQRFWRGHRTKVKFELEAILAIKVQAATRGRQARRVISSQHTSSRVVQRVIRIFLSKLKMRRMIDAEAITRINIELKSFAAVIIQRTWRGYRVNMDFMLIIVSAITIQSFTRRNLRRRRANTTTRASPRAPAAVGGKQATEKVTYETEQMKIHNAENNGNAQVLQHHFEATNQINGIATSSQNLSPRARIQPSSVSTSAPDNGTRLNSPTFCQANSSGILLPKKSLIPPLHVKKHASTFGRHTSKALRIIKTSKSFREVFKAARNLEKITLQSIVDCKLIVETDAQHKMLFILRSCNRSSPHLDLIRVLLSVFTNLSQHPFILKRLANDYAINTMADIVHMFRDKSNIFALSSSLLEKMLRSSHFLMSDYSTPENKKRLDGILLMSKRKTSALDGMLKGICCLENIVSIMNSNNTLN